MRSDGHVGAVHAVAAVLTSVGLSKPSLPLLRSGDGKWSASAAASCSSCAAGKEGTGGSKTTEISGCSACAVGFYSVSSGSAACTRELHAVSRGVIVNVLHESSHNEGTHHWHTSV